ncbi:pre-mRNA-processing protein prp40 [Panus rudis PR-1116 ss-1]|nr:pre-mRNA-processing protein prp40 [Panus rudis PR-1116 ss-1]
MNIWTEHRNPEGRTYWFNTGTRESVWEKPDELKTPFERALKETKWREYFSSGRKYYYNTETKESKWDMPDELILLLERVEKGQPKAPTAPNLLTAPGTPGTQGAAPLAGGTDPSSSGSQPNLNGQNGFPNTDQTVGLHTGGVGGPLPFTPNAGILPARPNLPEDPVIPHNGFATVEEGEKAFMHLLRKAGVDANWTWDQTMRSIITDPLYKALNTLAEKKAAWQKYVDQLKAKEQEEREARLSKLRPAIRNMLKGNPNVFHYTTFATADQLFAQHPIWQQAKIEAERKLIFEEYVSELKQREVQEMRAARSRSISKVVALFKKLGVDVLTRWRQAHKMVLDSEEWKSDAELQKLPTLDILLAFEDYSRLREREYEEQTRRAQVEKTRKERKAREAFKELLQELVNDGKIKARTKWKQVYPNFSDDKRYLDILGNPGSNPLELFWDVVDNMDQKLDAKIAVVEKAIKRYNDALPRPSTENEKLEGQEGQVTEVKTFKVVPETTKEELLEIIRKDDSDEIKQLTEEDLEEIYQTLHEQAVKHQADEKRRAERRLRHLQDDLRYALKKLPEPIDLNMSYEEAVPLMQDLPEYKAIEDEESRQAAFAKFVKRQKIPAHISVHASQERLREKEKEASEDGGSTTSRKRKEPHRDDHERARSRDYRDRDRDEKDSHHERESRSSKHHRHDDYDRHSSRDYGRGDRERARDYPKDKDYHPKDKDRDYGYRSSRHHRDYDDDRRRDRRGSRADYDYSRSDWDGAPPYGSQEAPPYREGRARSTSAYPEEPREKRERTVYEDKIQEERAEKRPRYEDGPQAAPEPEAAKPPPVREETPEEGEI